MQRVLPPGDSEFYSEWSMEWLEGFQLSDSL